MYRLLSVLLFSLLISTAGTAQISISELQKKAANWQRSETFSHAGIGITVSEYPNNEVILSTSPQISLAPASVLKLVTTATALEVFGPDFTFQTTLSYSGNILNDTLIGDMQIIGGGDPTLGSEYFPEKKDFMDKWIKVLNEIGIKSIKGNLIIDASIYDSEPIPNTWIWEDIGNYYGAGASGISVYDNQFEIHLKSASEAGKETQIIGISPEIPHLKITNEVISSDINKDEAYVFGGPKEHNRIIRGTIPKNRTDFVVKAAVPNPAELLASEFRNKLLANKISISGEMKYEKASSKNSVPISVIQSPPLKEIIRITNFESVNLFAEHLLKHLGYHKTGLGTTKDGCKFVGQFWKGKGIDMSGFYIVDGSGLSRFNAVTSKQIVDILIEMKTKSKYPVDFQQSMPMAGNGTLTVFDPDKFPDNSLHAKSGSMTRVRCFAGYLTTQSGRLLSFAILLNNFSCTHKEATRKIEELLVEIQKL
jgi:serine-type D-Ala-D-Ala carboxypeptidase/endopeptidase (penicillin-binding protein 4)